MSLYKSVLETLHRDFSNLESTMLGTILHGTGPEVVDPKLIGNAARVQWVRVVLDAVSKWCAQNPTATQAPESLFPGSNDEIDAILDPSRAALNTTTTEAAE